MVSNSHIKHPQSVSVFCINLHNLTVFLFPLNIYLKDLCNDTEMLVCSPVGNVLYTFTKKKKFTDDTKLLCRLIDLV